MDCKGLIINLIKNTLRLFSFKWTSIKDNSKYFDRNVKRYYILLRFLPFIRFTWFWYDNIQSVKVETDKFIKELFYELDENSKFTFTKLLYYAGKYSEEICEMVLGFANKTTNADYRYWTTMDISRFTFHLQKGFYPNYYNDRRLLLKQICEDMRLTIPQIKDEKTSKLCIVTHLLDKSIKNSAQRVATMISKGLITEFEEICIFPLDTFAPVGIEKKLLTTVLPYKASIESKIEIENLFPAGVKVHYPRGSSYKEKNQDVLNAIYEYNPCVILDMSDEYSAISYYYSKDFKTYYQPLRDNASSSFFSYYLAVEWKVKKVNEIFHSFPIEKNVNWVFPEYIPEKGQLMKKEEIGYTQNDFVIVCSGNNSTCCSEEFVDEIANLLLEFNDIKLLFVGQDAPVYFKEKYFMLFNNNSVREWGYENNLFGLYSACDVLIRPNMTGGSGATAIAAMAGIPIAMTNYICDPCRWLGLNYSKIDNYHQLMDYISKLSRDKKFYNNEKNKCINLVENAIDSKEKWELLSKLLKGGQDCAV